jgi:hypothetical protein
LSNLILAKGKCFPRSSLVEIITFLSAALTMAASVWVSPTINVTGTSSLSFVALKSSLIKKAYITLSAVFDCLSPFS